MGALGHRELGRAVLRASHVQLGRDPPAHLRNVHDLGEVVPETLGNERVHDGVAARVGVGEQLARDLQADGCVGELEGRVEMPPQLHQVVEYPVGCEEYHLNKTFMLVST